MRARGRELARGRGENKDKTMGSGVIDLLGIWVDGGFRKRKELFCIEGAHNSSGLKE